MNQEIMIKLKIVIIVILFIILKERNIEENKYEYNVVICSCHNTEHSIIICKNKDKNFDNNAYVSIHLVPERNIFKRIKNAIKYIFGYKCKYGCFDEIILNQDNYESIKELAEFLKPKEDE